MAVGDVALQFLLKLVRKPTLSKRKLNEQLIISPIEDKCSHSSSVPSCIQPKIITLFQKMM